MNQADIRKKVNFNTFDHKETLNPEIFKSDKTMYASIRNKMLSISEFFIDSLEVKSIKVKDVILTGSLANYNWSKYSDVDIHIIVDCSKCKFDKKLLADYFAMKKESFKKDHDGMKILDFAVELYVQDIDEKHNSSGQYSVMRNKWVVEPEPFTDEDVFDEEYVVRKTADFTNEIDAIEREYERLTDGRRLKGLLGRIDHEMKKMKDRRSAGLKKDGEYNKDNIVYKVVRRTDYIQKVFDLKNKIIDKIYSVENYE